MSWRSDARPDVLGSTSNGRDSRFSQKLLCAEIPNFFLLAVFVAYEEKRNSRVSTSPVEREDYDLDENYLGEFSVMEIRGSQTKC